MNLLSISDFPEQGAERDQWILARRGPREPVRADRPYAFIREEERFESGEIGDVATIFLTNRECPWRCTMCDLWRHTLPYPLSIGDISRQIDFALRQIPGARQVKLYNSGSFFDVKAIPVEDYPAIVSQVRPFERVIVESHPSLISGRCFEFARLLHSQLEVAIGLETAHPEVLEKLNKRMTLEHYARAADQLRENNVALRSFILLQPPFLRAEEALEWACRSIDFAQAHGASVVTLIPTRAGNGATDELARRGEFRPPSFALLEKSLEYGIGRDRGRVFLDLWDVERVGCCPACRSRRTERLATMNLSQTCPISVVCRECESLS